MSEDPVSNRILTEFRRLMLALRSGEGTPRLFVDLTMAQLKTLWFVCAEKRVSGRKIAGQLGVGPSAVTPLVDRLVEHGYVRREEDVDDRRITWILPTDLGLSLVDHLQTARREQLGKVLGRLSPDERQLVARVLTLLRQAAEHDPDRDEVANDSGKD